MLYLVFLNNQLLLFDLLVSYKNPFSFDKKYSDSDWAEDYADRNPKSEFLFTLNRPVRYGSKSLVHGVFG